MKKKNVVFLIESFIVGGAEKVLIDIVNHLNKEKFEVTVVSVFKYSVYKDYNQQFQYPFSNNIHYYYLIDNHNKVKYTLFNYFFNKFPRLFYNHYFLKKYDTVVAFYEGLPTYWIGNSGDNKTRKIAWLHTVTELSQDKNNFDALDSQRIIYKTFDKIIAVSEAASDSFKKLFHLNPQVIYNPIDIKNIQIKAGLNTSYVSKKVTFISVGRITPCKGYDRVIDIALSLKNKGYDFVWEIVGGGNITDLSKMVEKNSLTHNIKFLGHQDNPYKYINRANVFISTSYIEGLGISLIEALALGVPVVSSNFNAAFEILGNNQYGIICKSNKEFVSVLEDYILHPGNFEKFVALGKKRASDFSIDVQIKKIEAIL